MALTSIEIRFRATERALAALFLWMCVGASEPTCAQSTDWQSITASGGVEISFIVHRYGDGKNAGVVIRLVNQNHAEVTYRFRVIFRSGDRERISDLVTGVLSPLEVKTGELSGLWWIPFKDGAPVTEVGLKGLRVNTKDHPRFGNDEDETS